jgi:hypothetical protein
MAWSTINGRRYYYKSGNSSRLGAGGLPGSRPRTLAGTHYSDGIPLTATHRYRPNRSVDCKDTHRIAHCIARVATATTQAQQFAIAIFGDANTLTLTDLLWLCTVIAAPQEIHHGNRSYALG